MPSTVLSAATHKLWFLPKPITTVRAEQRNSRLINITKGFIKVFQAEFEILSQKWQSVAWLDNDLQ